MTYESYEPGLVPLIAPKGMVGADVKDAGQSIYVLDEEESHFEIGRLGHRRDFALGRHCAHKALDRLGVKNAVVARNKGGAPVWPAEVVGSITHTKGYAAALIAAKKDFSAVGVDAERVSDLPGNLARHLFVPEEQVWLAQLDNETRSIAATIIFSAKEAFFKACLADKTRLSFRTLRVDVGQDTFSVIQSGVVNKSDALGRFTVVDDLVLTSVSVPAS
jgi:4'-phosphopantetheinyl transferase EntD